MEANNTYKVDGAVILLVLHHGLEGAFSYWMLAQKEDRKRNKGKPSGIIRNNNFFTKGGHTLGFSKKKQRKYQEEALRYGFFTYCGPNLQITSRRKLFFKLMDMHDKYVRERNEEHVGSVLSEVFLKNNIEFTRKYHHWVVNKDRHQTKRYLTEVATIQNSLNFRGKAGQGRILQCDRRTIQRRNRTVDLKEVKQFILIDPSEQLENPECNQSDMVDAYRHAEQIYRNGGMKSLEAIPLHGRSIIQRRRIYNKPYVAIQLPNICYSEKNVKEVPSKRKVAQWCARNESGSTERRNVADSTLTSKEEPRTLSAYDRRSLSSGVLGGNIDIPVELVYNYVRGLFSGILEDPECRKYILNTTGADEINASVFNSTLRTYRDSLSTYNATQKLYGKIKTIYPHSRCVKQS